ncbi:MAG TPA: glycosyltransferase family A protein [Mycobacteriales bacterium]|nr:glycosyltransferase family A protein [Mycobacteriales bacterium]
MVIRALNEERHIGRLLAGLSHQTVKPDEIILVDSGSTDATVDIAERYGCRIVRIPKEQFSFGRALNWGCEAATGEVLFMLSAHVYPVFDTYIEHMLKPFDRAETAVAYGRQVGDGRTKYSESRVMLKWFPEESIWDQGHPFSNNANAAVRREVWAELRYDEELTGLEDLEFADRAIGKGFTVAYVAEAPVVHVHEEPWDRIRNRYRREAIAYKRIMGEKRLSALEATRLAVANIGTDYWHALRDRQLSANLIGIPMFRVAQFLGAFEGFKSEPALTEELRRRFYYPLDLARPASPEEPGQRIDYTGHEG